MGNANAGGSGASGSGAGAGAGVEFGVDPSLEPELATVSLDKARPFHGSSTNGVYLLGTPDVKHDKLQRNNLAHHLQNLPLLLHHHHHQ